MKKIITILFIFLFTLIIIHCSTSTSTSNNNDEDDDTPPANTTQSLIVADHTAVADFDDIPTAVITDVKNELHIYYAHTSHGSQLVTGTEILGSPYDSGLDLTENEDTDLGHNGDTSFVDTTEAAIAADSTINVVIWSWCGGVADNTTSGINAYLSAMNQLEEDYPNITFVYMTGRHWNEDATAQVDGEDADTNTHIEAMNDVIRDYVNDNDKVLFDFADIEEYDPNGSQYTNTSDGCIWCEDWCNTDTSVGCTTELECAHSHTYNCYIKGKAFWWLLARISGWDGTS